MQSILEFHRQNSNKIINENNKYYIMKSKYSTGLPALKFNSDLFGGRVLNLDLVFALVLGLSTAKLFYGHLAVINS